MHEFKSVVVDKIDLALAVTAAVIILWITWF